MYFLQNFVSHFPRPSFHCRFFHKRGGGGEKHEEEDLEETGGSANGSGGGWVEGARQGRSLFFSFSSLLPSFCGFYTHTHTQRNSPPFHCWCRQSSTWIRRNFGLRRVHNLVSNSGALLPTLLCSSLLSASATAGSYESSIFSCRKETSIYLSPSTARLISYSVLVRGRFETTGFFFLILDSQRMCVKLHAVCVQTGCLTLCYRVRV